MEFSPLETSGISAERETNIKKAIEACQVLIKSLGNPHLQPLEREAGYLLAKALRIQVEELGLLEYPEVQEFLEIHQTKQTSVTVWRYPQDFVESFES